ncbi:MAG: ACP S-malonyltransferase [Flavobacteriaceae bacterium]|jgi:[acyl-carrier-protein] S-malonyltransferase
MKAYIFPGQGSQFPGMGKELYELNSLAKERFETANSLLGFRITDIMFGEDAEALKETRVTQPALFLHSTILSEIMGNRFAPEMVAGHSLGEFSALVAAGALRFEDGLLLVAERAQAMQDACNVAPGAMAAILGLEDKNVENICRSIEGVVVAANYNCPGQLVISGEQTSVEQACIALSDAGARRALLLPVGGAFHSPLMEPAKARLAKAIEKTIFQSPRCDVYQNVTAKGTSDTKVLKENLVAQLTAPVRWTETIQNMIADGASYFSEVGPGKVLQGLVKKINRDMETDSGA